MLNFKLFLEQKMSEEDKNVKDTLGNIPDSHRALVSGYKFNLQNGNTLDGDDKHVGFLDDKQKTIAVAAPWNYGREFTFLHEIAHRVWDQLLSKTERDQWQQICPEDSEEKFCMAYANFYVKNPIAKYNKSKWKKFIQGISK